MADSVAQAVRGDARQPAALGTPEPADGHAIQTRPETIEAARKADLLRACDEHARAAAAEVTQVRASYAESRREVEVFNSEGLAAADDRTRVRLGVQVVARRERPRRDRQRHPRRPRRLGARRGRPRGGGREGRQARAHAARRRRRPHRPAAGRGRQRLRRRPAPRGRRARPRGRRRPEARQRLRRPARRPARRVLRDRLRRRPPPRRLGQRRHRRRGHPHPPHDGDRGRAARLLPLRPPARPQGRRRVDRQRPARVVPPPAGARA